MLKTIALKNRRSLIAGYSLAKRKTRKWLVFVPESGADFDRGGPKSLNWLFGARLGSRFNHLIINKPGLGPRGVNEAAFEKSFRRQRRIADALTTLKAIIPKGDEIVLIGYSEGAYLAPEIAVRDSRVRTVVMIGGGTRGWLKEELANAKAKDRAAMAKQIRLIYKKPRSTRKWNGFSFATWYSYREDATLRALRGLKIPVFAILGARDRTIDLKTTVADLRRLGKTKNIYTRVLRGCGHSFKGQWVHVRRAIHGFFKE